MEFIILCPYLTRTGGPEALHQLSDALLGMGQDAKMWYTTEQDLNFLSGLNENQLNPLALKVINRKEVVEEYKRYRVKPVEELVLTSESVIVIPESQIHWLNYFRYSRKLIWWLSVDNAFRSLVYGSVNTNWLRRRDVVHACQSSYAENFIRAMGFRNACRLTDFTPDVDLSTARKCKVSIAATSKVIFNVNKLAAEIEALVDVEIVQIKNLTRAEVYDAFLHSYVYIDLGNFPGKDRMAREAALLGCLPITLDVAGAEYASPELLKVGVDQVCAVPALVQYVIENYDQVLIQNQEMVQKIRAEELQFKKEVAGLIKIFSDAS
jgi:hypothetical protein